MSRHPVLARMEGSHRYYLWGTPPEGYWSVTSIIDGGVPKYLVPWAAKTIADLILADLETMKPHSRASTLRRRWMRQGREWVAGLQAAGQLKSVKKAERMADEELIARWLKGQPERIRDTAADLGSDVHAEADQLVKQLALESGDRYAQGLAFPDWPERLRGHMTSFQRFLVERQPEYIATEATVFNRTQAYAGTLDAVAVISFPLAELRAFAERVPGGMYLGDLAPDSGSLPDPLPLPVVLDIKSGRSVYPTVALQLAAYARSEFIGLPDGVTQLPMPAVELGVVLHLTPTGYALRLVRIDDEVYRGFLHAREVYRFNRELAGKVLGAPVFESAKEAA